MKTLRLSPFKFGSWLEEKAGSNVGLRKTKNQCPLHNFVRGEVTEQPVLVNPKSIRIGEKRFRLPDWAQNFILEIDEQDGPIGASEALQALRDALS